MRSSSRTSTYQVGFGKPPKNTQFRKGVSGNPGGRPRGSRNLVSILQNILEETMTIHEGRKRRRVSKGEAMLRSLVKRAVSGEVNAITKVTELVPAQEFEDVSRLKPIKTEDGVLVPNTILQRRMVRKLESFFGLKRSDGSLSYVVITEKDCERMAAQMKKLFGWQPTNEQALKMANTTLLVKEADEQTESGKPVDIDD